MKQSWILTGAFAAALTAGLAAQATQAPGAQSPNTQTPSTQAPSTATQGAQTPSTQTPQTSSESRSSMQERSVTMTGCIQAGGSAPSATPGAVGTAGSAAGTQFLLTNARRSMGASGGAAPSGNTRSPETTTAPGAATPGAAPGASTSAGASSMTSTYALDGQAAQFKDHVGHEVEVTGRISPARPATSASDAAAAAMNRFEVQSVKMVAASCNTSAR